MSSANTALRVTELDFVSIKENIKNYLRGQSEFQDFDFEGSAMSVLLDILAYNTHYMGYYVNMVGNEMFLDTAQIRQSVISHAKMINYFPKSPRASEVKVNIRVTPSINEDQSVTTLTLDKYTRFLGRDIDGVNYQFVTNDTYNTSKSNGSFQFANVTLKQGEVVTRQFVMDSLNIKRRFDIPSANIDTDTVSIIVQESAINTYTEVYTAYQDVLDINANTKAYFIEENEKGQYSVYFGDNVVGKRPKDGNIITITYLDVMGSMTNKINNFAIVQTAGGYFNDNVSVTTISASYSGAERETIADVRYRAPYHYATQNRAVTVGDYETLILRDYSNIDAVKTWGGEDNDPPIYGKVFLSLKTKENYFLSNQEKENIKESLIRNRNVLTVIPEIVDPDYSYIIVRGDVYYDPTLTSLSAEQIKSYARAAVIDYKTRELTGFDATFRLEDLQSFVKTSEKSIKGSDMKVFLQKRIQLTPSETKKYTINANFPIKKGDYNQQIASYPTVKVYDSSNTLREVKFEEVPEAFTGVDSIEIVNPGINYTSTPTITITGDGSGATAVARIAGGRIVEITVTNKGVNYTRAVVSISGVGSEASAVAKLQSKFGKLRTFYTKENGEKVIVNAEAGTINYETGFIDLTSVFTLGTTTNDFYDTNILTFDLPIERHNIYPLRNRIVDIDENDARSIQLTVLPE
jgi:hypothetical protein